MSDCFPPLLDPSSLPSRVLCLAPHPDDEVIACGGALAFHAARGDRVRVVVVTDGSGPGGDEALAAQRVKECRAGLQELGVGEVSFLGLPDGGARGHEDLLARLEEEWTGFDPTLCYAPSPFERHPDHLATFEALARLGWRFPGVRVLLWGVNHPGPADLLLDISAWLEIKRRALEAHSSQNLEGELALKITARDAAATIDVDIPDVRAVERFGDRLTEELLGYGARARAVADDRLKGEERPAATAVLTSFNKCDDVRANLGAIFSQTLPFESVVVVDNASSDGTAEMIEAEFPQVRLVVMPDSSYGACETFNVGFASSRTPLTAILDDDIVMPPDWLEKATTRMLAEPETTAIVSTKVVEPGMPESYSSSPEVNTERYMSTFRGCASLARTKALREAGYYDERLFIYGNERDLTCRLLNLGYRVLQYPGTEVFHQTPFGIKPGPRSLYFHARNAWLTMLKYAPARDLLALPWLVLCKVVLRSSKREARGEVTDAVGTIGIGASLRETRGAFRIVLKAALSVLWNVPYCLKHRQPVRSDDFELPLR